MAAQSERKIVIMGDTFVRMVERLHAQVFLPLFRVYWGAHTGATTTSIFKHPITRIVFRDHLQYRGVPELVLIILGGNDLVDEEPKKVAKNLVALAEFIHHGYGVPHVLVSELFERKTALHERFYNGKVKKANAKLKKMLKHHPTASLVRFHGFQGKNFLYEKADRQPYDGVHPSPTKLRKLANEMKRVLLANLR
jgi:lysophospholipase L1-like esterase